MAEYGLDVQGGGSSTSLRQYAPAVSEGFPRVTRVRPVESSIASRNKLDILPVNLEGSNNEINDSYIEFRIPGVPGQFLDLSTLTIDLKTHVTKANGSKLGDTDHVVFANGLSNTLFKNCTCYFNEQMVESNALFNYHAFVKMVTSIPQEKLDSIGRSSFFFRDNEGKKGIVDTYSDEYFTEGNKQEKQMIADIKAHGLSMTAPLLLDIASLDAYLLDSTDVRIRLELASKSWILNTSQDGDLFKFALESVKLWVDRVVPHASALSSLNTSLVSKSLQYTYNRTLYKTYVLGINQTSLLAELPFAQIIPQNLIMVMVDMDNMSGSYNKNGLYFTHADLSHAHISINGSTVYNIRSQFPHHVSRLFYSTLEGLGLETANNLTLQAFAEGRTLCAFNFVTEDVENGIPLEKSGNMRISLTFNKGHNRNLVIIFFADTTGVIEIDAHRQVTCQVRA